MHVLIQNSFFDAGIWDVFICFKSMGRLKVFEAFCLEAFANDLERLTRFASTVFDQRMRRFIYLWALTGSLLVVDGPCCAALVTRNCLAETCNGRLDLSAYYQNHSL